MSTAARLPSRIYKFVPTPLTNPFCFPPQLWTILHLFFISVSLSLLLFFLVLSLFPIFMFYIQDSRAILKKRRFATSGEIKIEREQVGSCSATSLYHSKVFDFSSSYETLLNDSLCDKHLKK